MCFKFQGPRLTMPEGCQLPGCAYQNDEWPRHGRKAFPGRQESICEGGESKEVCLSELSNHSISDNDGRT